MIGDSGIRVVNPIPVPVAADRRSDVHPVSANPSCPVVPLSRTTFRDLLTPP